MPTVAFIIFGMAFKNFYKDCFCKFFELKNANHGHDEAATFSLSFRAVVNKKFEYIFSRECFLFFIPSRSIPQ